MSQSDPSEVTQLLNKITGGNQQAFDDLLPLVYEEMRAIAQRHMRKVSPGHTLQATALVNEACLKMMGPSEPSWENRAHFLNAASRAMRHILVDHARGKASKKRGGEIDREGADKINAVAVNGVPFEDLVSLDECLTKLADYDERKARCIELKFFAGLGSQEVGEVMGLDLRTVQRDCNFAIAWLTREMQK